MRMLRISTKAKEIYCSGERGQQCAPGTAASATGTAPSIPAPAATETNPSIRIPDNQIVVWIA